MVLLSDIDQTGNECLIPGIKIGNDKIPQKVEIDDVEIGDLLICYTDEEIENKSFNNRVIQQMTKGIYGHVGIVVDKYRVVDATGSGVKINLIEDFIKNYTLITIMRDKHVSYDQQIEIVGFLKRQIGKPYNKSGAALLPLCREIYWKSHYWLKEPKRLTYRLLYPLIKTFIRHRYKAGFFNPEKSKYFCSELALASFNKIGRADFNHWINPLVISPNDLINQNIGFTFQGYLTKHKKIYPHENDIHVDE
ncbi:MAG: hypothetical protein HUN04_22345 [Desulfobacter sp.]|nr:MAG: hypothetical protein HUN04_22345 [Desulfobacter sp.]